ncbi:MAG: molybdenum cofactor biosynthesis protein MoaE [Desulfonatronovibrionaceae bacterium]
MDSQAVIHAMKENPDFAARVGMILVHNGVVRQWSRKDNSEVVRLEVKVDHLRIADIVRQAESRPGIYRVVAEAREGEFFPGDDLMLVVVAGDVRENVFPVLQATIDRIKKEALSKREITAGSPTD